MHFVGPKPFTDPAVYDGQELPRTLCASGRTDCAESLTFHLRHWGRLLKAPSENSTSRPYHHCDDQLYSTPFHSAPLYALWWALYAEMNTTAGLGTLHL